MSSVSDQKAEGIAALRARLAEKYLDFAAADSFEQGLESFCTTLRCRLKAARKERGIGQSELAERMQIGQPAVSRIENGAGDIGLKTLRRYAEALGLVVTIDLRTSEESEVTPGGDPSAATAVEEALAKVDKARDLLATASAQLAVV